MKFIFVIEFMKDFVIFFSGKFRRSESRSAKSAVLKVAGVILCPATMAQQISQWCFTFWEQDRMPGWNPDKMRYMVYQAEQCPDTGKKHFQGYVEFHRTQKMGMVKKALGSNTVHLGPRQGSRAQARDYCMKEDTRLPEGGPFEFGEWIEGQQGKRTDLEDVAKKIKEGKSFKEITEEHTTTVIRYTKGIKAVQKILNVKKRPEEVENIILYGDTGCGKSTYIWRKFPEIWTGYIPGWWEGYDKHDYAFYDEFDGAVHMDVSLFKKVTDKFPLNVPCKGDSIDYVARVNLFASNINPRDWYPRQHWEAIKRRMNHIIYCRRLGDERFYTCEVCEGECGIADEIKNAF